MNGKRTLMLFVAMVLICASCFASILQIGGTATKYVNWNNENVSEDLFRFKDMEYGAEARVNVSHLTLTAGAGLGKDAASGKFTIESSVGGMITLGPSMANIGVGITIPHTLGVIGQDNLDYNFLESPINLRASLNFSLLFLGVSASYIMPTNVSLKGLTDFGSYGNFKAVTECGAIQIAAFIGLI